MFRQYFLEASALSGIGFEDFLDSFRISVPDFKAWPNGRSGEKFRWQSEVVNGAGVTLLASRVKDGWTTTRETNEKALSIFLPCFVGSLGAKIDGKEVFAGPKEAVLAPMSQIHQLSHLCETEYAGLGFIFDSIILTKVLNSLVENARLEDLSLASVVDLSSGPGVNLFLILQSLDAGMRRTRLLENSPKSMALLVEAALAFIFESVPNRFQSRIIEQFEAAVPLHIGDAIDYMHSNMHQPLTITDIATAVGVSVRSLQLGFRQYKNTTPRHYLRKIRLEEVHNELRRPENVLSISDVALKWGFSHLGRFAAQYKAAFGVAPSETVRRARAGG